MRSVELTVRAERERCLRQVRNSASFGVLGALIFASIKSMPVGPRGAAMMIVGLLATTAFIFGSVVSGLLGVAGFFQAKRNVEATLHVDRLEAAAGQHKH